MTELATFPAPYMTRPEKIVDLEDVKVWIAEHDGRTDAYWQQQRQWNNRTEDTLKDHANRLLAVEKRVMWFAGMAAAIGAVLGTILSTMMSG